MVIRLTAAGMVVLEAAEDLRRFCVAMPEGASVEGSALAGLMVPEGAEHAWVDPARLRAMGPAEAGWASGFDAMVAHAAGRGWTDAEGRLRAHIERN